MKPRSLGADLTPAEARVCEAVREGVIADFTEWTDGEPALRGWFLRRLIAGLEEGWPLIASPLRIRGARVTGALTTPPQGGARDTAHAVVSFSHCRFDEPVNFSGAEFQLLRFVSCEIPGFIGAGLVVRSDLDLGGSKLSGVDAHSSELLDIEDCSVHLVNARIGGRLHLGARPDARFEAARTVRLDGAKVGGELSFEGALLHGGDGRPALSARSMNVDGGVLFLPKCGWRFKAIGEVILAASRIIGDLRFSGGVYFNPEGRAIHAEDVVAESIMLSAFEDMPLVAAGRINFLSATAGGMMVFSNARLWPGPDYAGVVARGGPVAINLQQLRVSNALIFNNVGALAAPGDEPEIAGPHAPVEGWFLLSGAELNTILDHIETGWPAPGYLELQGASYVHVNRIDGVDDAASRLKWLALQFPGGRATADSYRSQPYEELSRVLRRHGRNKEADEVAVEKIRQRLAARVENPWARVFPQLLMAISRHGYSPGRAAMSFVIFVALGALAYVLAMAGFNQPFVPVENAPEPVTYHLLADIMSVSHARGCPGLFLPQYALDAALPIVDLGQTSYCRFAPEGAGAWAWSAFETAYRLAGAALSAVVVLTLTGLLRRD